jgi:hypothetical protein
MSDDDAELVALIDIELDESRRTAILARLAADEQLRQRYEELRQTGAPLAVSLDALLGQAPLARLCDALPPAGEPLQRPSRCIGGIALRELAAGVIIGLLAAGVAVWALGLFGGREDWRSAVAEYIRLYTNETFSPLNPDAALEAEELGSALNAAATCRSPGGRAADAAIWSSVTRRNEPSLWRKTLEKRV